jgi:hypothetical protein
MSSTVAQMVATSRALTPEEQARLDQMQMLSESAAHGRMPLDPSHSPRRIKHTGVIAGAFPHEHKPAIASQRSRHLSQSYLHWAAETYR